MDRAGMRSRENRTPGWSREDSGPGGLVIRESNVGQQRGTEKVENLAKPLRKRPKLAAGCQKGVEQLTGKAKEPSPNSETGAEAAHGEIKANCPSDVSSTNPAIGKPR